MLRVNVAALVAVAEHHFRAGIVGRFFHDVAHALHNMRDWLGRIA